MKYENKSFSVPLGSQDYQDNWERIFGNKKKEEKEFSEDQEIPAADGHYEGSF